MLAEIICAWCFCTAVPHAILDCGRVKTGTPDELSKASSQMKSAGQMLTAECHGPGEQFIVDWEKK